MKMKLTTLLKINLKMKNKLNFMPKITKPFLDIFKMEIKLI